MGDQASGDDKAGRAFSVRCADVHPVRCAQEVVAPSVDGVVAGVVEHGADAHDFTHVWYTTDRIAAISRAVQRG